MYNAGLKLDTRSRDIGTVLFQMSLKYLPQWDTIAHKNFVCRNFCSKSETSFVTDIKLLLNYFK